MTAPWMVSAAATRKPSTAITIAKAFAVRNDIDVDSTNLTVSAVATKSKNGATITSNITNMIYAASTSTNSDWFTYTVKDAALTSTGTITVNVATNGVLIVY